MRPAQRTDRIGLPRRGLIHGIGLGVAAAGGSALAQGAGGVATGRPMPEMERPLPGPDAQRVGYAIVGLGQFTLDEVLPGFAASGRSRVVALVSGNRAKAEDVAARYGVDRRNLYDYANFDSIRDNPSIEAVYVVLPNGLHAEYAIRAFRAGKHVLCEKPMANSPEEGEAMIRAGAEAGRKLMIAYRQRFEPLGLKARALIEEGALGTPRLVASDHHRHLKPSVPADQWRMDRALSGGGSLVDIGIYSLQAARMMTGEEPLAVSATLSTPRGDDRFRQVEDMVAWSMRFPSGAMAHLSSSYTGGRLKRIQVLGTKAAVMLDPGTEYHGNRLTLRGEDGAREIRAEGPNQFSAEFDHFSGCIRDGGAPRTPGEEGLRDLRLIRAIYAAAEGGGWLALNPDGSHRT